MQISELSLKEWLLLCRRARRRYAEVLRQVADGIRPVSERLARQLCGWAQLRERELESLTLLDEATRWPRTWHLDERAIRRLLLEHFPALFGALRAPCRDSGSVLLFLERVEQESARFHRALAEQAREEEHRHLFWDLAVGDGESDAAAGTRGGTAALHK